MALTYESIQGDIYQSIQNQQRYAAQYAVDPWASNAGTYENAATSEATKQQELTALLKSGGFTPEGGSVSGGQPSTMDPTALANTTKSAAAQMGVSNPGQSEYDTRLKAMMTGSFGPDDPSYQWRFDQGQQAVERSQAAKGLLGSGNALQELMTYGQGMASTEYQAQFARLMSGSQQATSQYDSAIKGLSAMAGIEYNQGMLGVAQQNAQTNAFSAQATAANQAGQLGLANSKFDYQKTQDSAAEQAHKDYLATLANPTGQQVSNPNPNSPLNSGAYISPGGTTYLNADGSPMTGTFYQAYSVGSSSTVDNGGYTGGSGSWSSSSGGGGEWDASGYSGD